MDAVDVLKKARALIRRGWCQGGAARSAKGRIVSYRSKRATRYCPLGAIWRVEAPTDVERSARDAIAVAALGRDGYVGEWNDMPGRKKAEVIRAFDRAIAIERKAR